MKKIYKAKRLNGEELFESDRYDLMVYWMNLESNELEVVSIESDYTTDVPSTNVITFKFMRRKKEEEK